MAADELAAWADILHRAACPDRDDALEGRRMLSWGAPAELVRQRFGPGDVTPEAEPVPISAPPANSTFGVESGAGNGGREEDYLTGIENPEEPLRETGRHHDPYEQVAPNSDWWGRYAPEMTALRHADTPQDAFDAGGR